MNEKKGGGFEISALSVFGIRNRKVLQGFVGILVFVVFVFLTLQSVQALQQLAGYYGYYNGTYGYNSATTSSDALPNPPSGFSPGARSANQLDFSWTAPTLTTASTSLNNLSNYTVAYATTSLTNCTSGTTSTVSTTNATLTSLSSGTTYYIAVCTNDTNGNQSTGLTSSMTTTSGGGGGGGGGGGSSSSSSTSTDSTTAAPADTSSEAGASTSAALSIGVATPVSVGSSTHTVSVSSATDAQATLTISSDPITLTINKSETQDLDTNSDGIKDLRITYNGLVSGAPSFTFVALKSKVAYAAPSGQGLSPVTGKAENITAVAAGDYIKSPSFSTVYYVTGKFSRRPFMDGQTFFTWQDSFTGVKTVTDATLSALPLEGPMLPKTGVVLVKIQSDAKTYAVTANPDDAFKPTLRWVASEAVAKELYGAAWSSYVIDVPPTLFPRFKFGASIEKASDLVLPPVTMKMRTKLN